MTAACTLWWWGHMHGIVRAEELGLHSAGLQESLLGRCRVRESAVLRMHRVAPGPPRSWVVHIPFLHTHSRAPEGLCCSPACCAC